MNTDNCILNGCFNYLYDMCLNNPNETNNWVCCVRNEICRIGLSNLWHAQQSLCKEHLVIIKQRLYDIAKQELDEILHTSPKCNLYQYYVPTFYMQTYLTKPMPELYKKYIIKTRLSSHNLENRNCKFCIEDMEDEMHFILLCPMHTNLR
jgi:hypothetical protein